MKGMIKKDIMMILNNYKTLLVTALLFIFYSVTFEMDMSFFLPMMGIMICISTLNYDDFNNWHTYASTLPQGRINVVKSKYITSIGVLVIFTIVGVLFSVALQGAKPSNAETLSFEFILGEVLALVFMMSVLYPILFKFGAEKGRLSMVMIGLSIVGIYMLCTKVFHINPSKEFIQFLDQYMIYLCIGISIVLSTVSYIISKKIYLNREF